MGGTTTPNLHSPSGNPIGVAKLPTPNPPSKVGTPGPPSKSPTPAPSSTAPGPQQVLHPAPPTAPTPKPATPAPSEPPVSQANGSSDRDLSKKEKRKQKEKDKREAAKATATGASGSGSATPADKDKGEQKRSNGLAPQPPITADGPVLEPTSPVAETASGGSQTPVGRRGSRNPWTLFVKHLPVPVSEEEIREFFGEAAPGVSATCNLGRRHVAETC